MANKQPAGPPKLKGSDVPQFREGTVWEKLKAALAAASTHSVMGVPSLAALLADVATLPARQAVGSAHTRADIVKRGGLSVIPDAVTGRKPTKNATLSALPLTEKTTNLMDAGTQEAVKSLGVPKEAITDVAQAGGGAVGDVLGPVDAALLVNGVRKLGPKVAQKLVTELAAAEATKPASNATRVLKSHAAAKEAEKVATEKGFSRSFDKNNKTLRGETDTVLSPEKMHEVSAAAERELKAPPRRRDTTNVARDLEGTVPESLDLDGINRVAKDATRQLEKSQRLPVHPPESLDSGIMKPAPVEQVRKPAPVLDEPAAMTSPMTTAEMEGQGWKFYAPDGNEMPIPSDADRAAQWQRHIDRGAFPEQYTDEELDLLGDILDDVRAGRQPDPEKLALWQESENRVQDAWKQRGMDDELPDDWYGESQPVEDFNLTADDFDETVSPRDRANMQAASEGFYAMERNAAFDRANRQDLRLFNEEAPFGQMNNEQIEALIDLDSLDDPYGQYMQKEMNLFGDPQTAFMGQESLLSRYEQEFNILGSDLRPSLHPNYNTGSVVGQEGWISSPNITKEFGDDQWFMNEFQPVLDWNSNGAVLSTDKFRDSIPSPWGPMAKDRSVYQQGLETMPDSTRGYPAEIWLNRQQSVTPKAMDLVDPNADSKLTDVMGTTTRPIRKNSIRVFEPLGPPKKKKK